MNNPKIIIAYDIGTTGLKTCFFSVEPSLKLLYSDMEGYDLNILENGGVEQNPDDWYQAMCKTTRRIMDEHSINPATIMGISFCAQMQGVVLVDKDGLPVRPAMSYMDQRGVNERDECLGKGIKVSGMNAGKLFTALKHTGAVAASVKDPVWKYLWVKNHEPQVYDKIHKWLDIKEYLILKLTGKFVMTQDSAFSTLLYDSRANKKVFHPKILDVYGVDKKHLPLVIKSTDQVGALTIEASKDLGLSQNTLVYGGGGDASLVGVGAGAVGLGDTHVYIGTSGWVSTVVEKRIVDINSMIASIQGANDKSFHYFAELETAGKCVEWVRDHLAKDEIGLYLSKVEVHTSKENLHTSLYDYMMTRIKEVPPGSGGVIFTPWLHGNRCPFEDSNVRGMFFNIGLETGKTALIRAVIEGVCYHLKWQLQASQKKIETSDKIRFVGGGALSPATCQILSDILEQPIETVDNPQNIGSVGAALVAMVGGGLLDQLEDAKDIVVVQKTFYPNSENFSVYRRNYDVFKSLYHKNKQAFSILNR